MVTWYLTNPRKIKDATKQEFPILTTRKQLEMLKLMQNFLFFVNFANSKTNLDSLRSETDYATNLLIIVVTFFIESTTTTTSSDISQNSLYPGHQ